MLSEASGILAASGCRAKVTGDGMTATLVDGLERAAVETTETLLRGSGTIPPPMVHMICADMEPSYVGFLTCRSFYRGVDAAEAVGRMGVLPSVLPATDLVVVWEYADLCTALELAGESFPTGVVVLEAAATEHTVRWHPFGMRVRPERGGVATVIPEWGAPARYPGGWLPDPVAALLAQWRQWREDADLEETTAGLERAGYRMRWTARS